MTTQLKNHTELQAALNRQTANWFLLGVKLHHYHWYVSGSQFFTLHEKFEELYNEAAGYADDLAERLLSIGGQPASTMKQYLELSDLQEARGGEDAKGMVLELVRDFKTVAKELQDAIATAEELSDQPTADLLIGIRSSIEKHAWMLNAFIG
ncbi:DNA starvation/stationary phase protection protein [Paenibacillus sp. VTT E-133280]|jgi:starvation-inducible DNA-binding protein|uniref:DNA starvation/stationary phase protection protein n=1 Tax=Paenibacillus odorifer TaxID=189426 RepID=A0A1R0ZKF3_9BACL|nr:MULTISPECIES: Dps family protein [Paenibacillus]AIQ22241.1 general stress protein [Paenibacillus sp. FSL H7-0737]KAA1183356.1 DNA starvation/stationary phase protection protein [Paenibacillus sp. B2(2019)]MDH6372053.1 starvation-inducible DNA-binding protein [Paenibacillus sp. PastF-3]OMD52736.1 DNA starvation/stationary phase protection protein [Paenibacillus odorifer]OME72164.1 DNA starvation/stationary phase protection protein [Paenibacillus odorifer]